MTDFECHCGKTFATAQRLGAHRTCHETVVCEACGATVGRQGIGGHRKAHRVAGELEETLAAEAAVAEARAAETARIIETLRDLTPPPSGRRRAGTCRAAARRAPGAQRALRRRRSDVRAAPDVTPERRRPHHQGQGAVRRDRPRPAPTGRASRVPAVMAACQEAINDA